MNIAHSYGIKVEDNSRNQNTKVAYKFMCLLSDFIRIAPIFRSEKADKIF